MRQFQRMSFVSPLKLGTFLEEIQSGGWQVKNRDLVYKDCIEHLYVWWFAR